MRTLRIIITETVTLFAFLFALFWCFVMLPAHGQVYDGYPVSFRLGPAQLRGDMDLKSYVKNNNIPQSSWIDWTEWHQRLFTRIGPIIARRAEEAGYPSGDVLLKFEVSASGKVHVTDLGPTLPCNYMAQEIMRQSYMELHAYPDDLQFPRGSKRMTTAYPIKIYLPPTGIIDTDWIKDDWELLPVGR